MTLGEYLSFVGGRPWAWGQPYDDCSFFAGTWWHLSGHPDPMAAWHGVYDDEIGATTAIEFHGGLLPLWIEALGPASHDDPGIGDIAVLHLHGHEAGGIWTGRRWAIRSERGWVATMLKPENVLGVWHQ